MIGLFVFIGCVLALLLGYKVYSRIAERVYGVELQMVMPCVAKADGVDYVAMPTWKIFLIQLLNIAGLGPVFGALAGCLFGPAALVWIVVGCILAGAVHDFLAAVMSAERGGANLPELVQHYLGRGAGYVMRFICIVLMLLVGVVFTTGPAGMLHALVSEVPVLLWCVLILLYYFLATVLPINVIIGRLYPVFGALFIFMALGLAVCLPLSSYEVLPQWDALHNMHPKGVSVWPMIFVTIACGAISGFHATQSPMMVRCLADIRRARPVFYGAMVAEGLVALIWAVVGLSLREVLTDYALVSDAAGKLVPQLAQEGQGSLSFAQLSLANPALAVEFACTHLLGTAGAVLAVLGVVVLPITSGDTAMRCCRLMLADALRIEQKQWYCRLAIAVPLFVCVIFVSQVDFSVIWRYFGWANQTLACFTLWSIAVCLRRRARLHWIATIPALFMTTVCTTFLLYAPECVIHLPLQTATYAGVGVAVLCLLVFLCRARRK